ncbi:MAG: hypothetical protein JJ896_03870 [Rhodothermales bacterium]|nr:hypothetical protein [Rhodothermales bacterium]MBO6778773.1 hypothetical protein [Rhodothermales bacterium]
MARQFTDAEVGAIIQKATELHEKETGAGPALSLSEVEHIASEMGLPASVVRRAAAQVASAPAPTRRGFLSIPDIRAAGSLPGPVGDAEWGHILQVLRRHLGGAGEAETVGNVRYWHRAVMDMGSEIARVDATVTSYEDSARMEVSRSSALGRILTQIIGTAAGAGLATVLAVAESAGPGLGITSVLVGGGLGLSAARLTLAASARRASRKLQDLIAHVSQSVPSVASEEPAVETALDATTARVVIPEDPLSAGTVPGGRQQTRDRS